MPETDGSSYRAQTTYDMDVSDNQPLLVHRPKPKEQRMRDLQGLEGPIFLIPELCYVTGLGTMRQVRILRLVVLDDGALCYNNHRGSFSVVMPSPYYKRL